MGLDINNSRNQNFWVCLRCQVRWSLESSFCHTHTHTPACLALMVPALTPLGGLRRLQIYADDAALSPALMIDDMEAEDAPWPLEPEAELSPRSCLEPEAEPLGPEGHLAPRPSAGLSTAS